MNATALSTLSPLVRADLLTSLIHSPRPIEEKHPQPEEVTAWECGVCGDLHKWEDDAHDCCAPAKPTGQHDDEGDVLCPVCRSGCHDHHEAASCCLWHDLDAPTRWSIADAVEAGSTWLDAIAKFAATTTERT